MKFHKHFIVFFGISIASPSFASCPGPGCPAGLNSSGDFIAGAIIGGIVGQNAETAKKRRRVYGKARTQSFENVEEIRDVQEALNFLGFDAGIVDGVFGSQTRKAIRGYQLAREFPVTGRLSDEGKAALAVDFRNAKRIRSLPELSANEGE